MAFQKVDPKPDFPEINKEILEFWDNHEIFKKSQEKVAEKGSFVFFEGPPTANGKPGVHHVISRVFKDIIPRYKTMRGYKVDRKGGWDTHGLPVELEVEKNLGISGKKEIEKYGIEKFNKKCRESVWKYVKEWEDLTKEIGFWVDVNDPYITYNSQYIESLWWVLGEAWKKDLLYEGHKVVPYCPRCGTALSSHEVAQGYKEVEDNSIYVKFPLEGQEKTFFLVWTTTPWTLPGNTGLALGPKITYVKVKVDKEVYILAKERVDQVLGGTKFKLLGEALGADIIAKRDKGLAATEKYQPLFPAGVKFKEEESTEEYRLIPGNFVSLEDGTGIVHIAPAFGEDDYNVGRTEHNLSVLMTVDPSGKMKLNPGKGNFVKEADPLIIEDLKSRNLLFKEEGITHTYPFCWRCSTPLLYYARDAWYIRMSALREKLVENNEIIQWYPANVKQGRFGEWLKEAKDWALSRERYWGTPLPIWKCNQCGQKELICSYKMLGDLSGKRIPDDFDPHRPYIDEYSWECNCGGDFQRYPHVLDCWFDSGAMPYAQWHYPYGGKKSEENFENHFPADYICEAVDQTRGWFYTLHAISTLLDKGPAFRNAISLGHILDEDGQKMSKSKGNVVNPWDVLKTHGADAVRWYMYSATTAGNPRNFSINLVGEGKRFLVTLWNVYSFFVTYANVDGYSPKKELKLPESALDKWIVSRKNQTIDQVTRDLDHYNIYSATMNLEKFLDELSNWYVRRSRKRFWKSENDKDKLLAYDTLYGVLLDFTKLLSPFMPFLTEKIYKNLTGEESVHLARWPKPQKDLIDPELESLMDEARRIVEIGLSKRNESAIKVRQPLASLTYGGKKLPGELEEIIREEVNVKKVIKGEKIYLETALSEDLKMEGAARDIVRTVQELRKKAGYNVDDRIRVYYEPSPEIDKILENFAGYIKKETLATEIKGDLMERADLVGEAKTDMAKLKLGVKKNN